MAKKRAAPAEDNERELRKIAAKLVALADEIEAGVRDAVTRGKLRLHRSRHVGCPKIAARLMLEALQHGGPANPQLRLIVASWRGKSNATWRCFYHVCDTWDQLADVRRATSFRRPQDWAAALRVIAEGVV